jgi:hypothetical protein
VESHIGPFGHGFSVGVGCTVCAKHTIGSKIVLDTRLYSKGMRLKWKLISISLEIVLILRQDTCTVCAKHTRGSKIILDALDGSPTDEAQVDARFSPFGHNANFEA